MSAFETFQQHLLHYGYPVLFGSVMLENAGVPVPGETAVLVAGFLASPAGGEHFAVVAVIGVACLAAILGDNISFFLGRRWARPRLANGRGFLFFKPQTLHYADPYFERYGAWTVFFARFVTGLRVVGALAAGTSSMHWSRFLIANAGGALAWATTAGLLGYFFGRSWQLIHEWLGWGGLALVFAVVVIVAVSYAWRRLHRKANHGDRDGR